jgi:hypothetical protein
VSTLSPSRRTRSRTGRLAVTVVVLVALLGVGGWFYVTQVRGSSTATPRASCPSSPGPTAIPIAFPRPAQITVNVYNATNRNGLARATSSLLVARGFRPGAVANDPMNLTIAGSAQVRYGPAASRAALVIAAEVPGAVLVRQPRTGTTVDLVLGNAFTALSTPAHVSAVLSHDLHPLPTHSATPQHSPC